MLSKMRSLSIKLTIIYIVSLFIIVGVTIIYVEYQNHQKDVWNAIREAEIGPGFINGAAPNSADSQITSNNHEYAITSADIDNRLARFRRFVDITVEGGVGWQTSIDGPITIDHQDYYNITFFDITNHKSGIKLQEDITVTIPKSNFPATIATYWNSTNGRQNTLYYLPVQGNDNLILVVSMNDYTFPIESWKQKLVSDIRIALPLALICSTVFGLLISWVTVLPLKRITQTTEQLSHSDLSQRVKYKSGDEIGHLAQSFNTMADRLEESFNSQKRFISDAAHELRTPLASMKTSVTSALSSDRSTSDYQKLLGFLSGRINHMEAMVNDLLFLSRVDEGKFKSDETKLDISRVLNESEEAFRYLFEDKRIEFSSNIESDLYVKGNRKLMLRVISNLLDNAAKNTPPGGLVSLRANYKDNNDVLITISDTGLGISPEHLAHLFERFYKVPGLSNNGYGLGLAISKSIIVSSGGKISVQSDPDKGSIFTIELPRYENSNLT